MKATQSLEHTRVCFSAHLPELHPIKKNGTRPLEARPGEQDRKPF
ncbi:hypothetical protein [Holospora curviuscula]|nr:hypothetical protein [Holospora curviuscula]